MKDKVEFVVFLPGKGSNTVIGIDELKVTSAFNTYFALIKAQRVPQNMFKLRKHLLYPS